jgi:O-antigen ligase
MLNWVFEGNFRQKIFSLRQKPALLLFSSVFLLYVAGFLFSENTKEGLDMILYMLPLLIIPIIMGTASSLSAQNAKQLLLLFSGAVLVASIVCAVIYLFNGIPAGGNFRYISVFKPHIRFSLEIDMAILILLYYSFFQPPALPEILFPRHSVPGLLKYDKYITLAGALFLIAFLFFFKSLTGIIILIIMALIFALRTAFSYQNNIIRFGLLAFAAAIALFLSGIILHTWFQNFKFQSTVPDSLEKYTVNGNPYHHDTVSRIMENGYYIGIYSCESELSDEWNKLSTIPYNETDLRGQVISSTINRYLTSKGLRKDSAALHSLNKTDLLNIEKGLANYKFNDYPSLYQRLYETLWEIQVYFRSGFIQKHSFVQRLAFIKLAATLIKEKPWTGVGPGDVCDSMRARSVSSGVEIDSLWNGKPHNQFVCFMLAFGIPGFLWIIFCWIVPVITSKTYRILLFNLFAGIMLISMFTLDTLESYDSIVFFAFFYSLFVFGVSIPGTKKA